MTAKFLIPTLLVTATCAFVASGVSQETPDPYASRFPKTWHRSPEDEKKAFQLPPGFEAQLVAAEPQIRKPMNMAFDAKGRLWVTESTEYPYAVEKGRKGNDCVKILEDFGPDGRARKVTTFADGLSIPIGVRPVKDGAIVFSIPYIWRLWDRDGDDKAESREILYGPFNFDDTHGLNNSFNIGFDGWMYACHGHRNMDKIKGKDGHEIFLESGCTYRFKIDGSRVEMFARGQVNPFGMSFDSLGNMYTADCHTQAVYMPLHGAEYPQFSRPEPTFGFGPQMCFQNHGSTALCGIAYYAADHFPPEYRDTIFVGNVMTTRINHDHLKQYGSTYISKLQPDFLKSDDGWFRPVDIQLGPDGALYIADFYNAVIGHYEVPLDHPARDRKSGRIWRIIYRGPDGNGPAPRMPRADWTTASNAELFEDLGHPNLKVRMIAAQQLCERGGPEIVGTAKKLIRTGKNDYQRAHCLWIVARCGKISDELIQKAKKDSSRLVRAHLMGTLAEFDSLSDQGYGAAYEGLMDSDAFVQRAAAQALRRHPASFNVWAILDCMERASDKDTHLIHTLRMALREQLNEPEIWKSQLSAKWNTDQIRRIGDAATGSTTTESAKFIHEKVLRAGLETGERAEQMLQFIARFGSDQTRAALIADAMSGKLPLKLTARQTVQAVFKGAQEAGSADQPELRQWIDGVARKLLESNRSRDVLQGIEMTKGSRLQAMRPTLLGLVDKSQPSKNVRRNALEASVTLAPGQDIDLLSRIIQDGSEDHLMRSHAAELLGSIHRPEVTEALAEAVLIAPKRVQIAIAERMCDTPERATVLMNLVESGKLSRQLLLDLPPVIQRHWGNTGSQEPFKEVRQKFVKLTDGLPPADVRLQRLLYRRLFSFRNSEPDIAQGAKVFEKHCATCHQLGGKGTKIGPELDGVGIRGPERVAEDILDPNRNVDATFQQTVLSLENGQLVTGLKIRDDGNVIVLADSEGKEVRVPKDEVAESTQSLLSLMPTNLIDQISDEDFNHLMGFLISQRPSDETKNE